MTILYIMKHNKTGKKYFGKSQKTFQEFKKYYGSGSYWTNHLKKHGRDITTRIYAIYDETDPYYKDILVSVALRFSEENDIVNSKEWANKKPENGLDGTVKGHKFSEETRMKQSEAHKGEKHWNYGRQHSEETKDKIREARKNQVITEETKQKISQANKGKSKPVEWAIRMGEVQRSKPRVECPHCGKVGAPNNMKRYHLDNCKFKPES